MLFETPVLTRKEKDVVGHINELRRQLRYATSTTKRWTGMLRRDAFARAIRGSNSIEGYNVTIDDAAAAAEHEEPFAADEKTWAAIVGYRDALTYVLQLENDPHFEHGEGLIRSLHYMMLKHEISKKPGQWRPGPIRVVDERKNEIAYEGPDAAIVPGLMRALVHELNRSEEDVPVMVRAAMAHLNLTMIHPFSDGNGRMARALQTLILVREGILSPTFCSIEEYLGRHQDDYYGVLSVVGGGKWQPRRDARPWIDFCLTAHYRCANDLLRRTREIQRVWEDIEIIVREYALPERTEAALVMAAFGRTVRNSIYQKSADVSDQVASRDLKKLVDAGLLAPKGERRGRVYRGSALLRQVRERNREPRTQPDPFDLAAPPRHPPSPFKE